MYSLLSTKGTRRSERLIYFHLNSIANQAAPQHGISCLDILQCGDSVGDGEYLIDPENGGNPLKVFCDMTTDGGINEISGFC